MFVCLGLWVGFVLSLVCCWLVDTVYCIWLCCWVCFVCASVACFWLRLSLVLVLELCVAGRGLWLDVLGGFNSVA